MASSNRFRKGQNVEWAWGTGTGSGAFVECFERDVTRTIKGAEITRKGSAEDPAYVLEQENGDRVLKLGSELKGTN